MTKKIFLIVMLLCFSCFLFTNTSFTYAETQKSFILSQNEYDTETDIREFINNCGGDRSSNTQGEEKTIAYIQQKFIDYNYEPFFDTSYVDDFQFVYGFGSNITSYNIAGIKKNNSSQKYVIVGAHYDTVNGVGTGFEGVYDNASGVVAMLNIARYCTSIELPYNIVFVSFGAEEYGAIGSQYFVETMGIEAKDILIYINLDAIGCGDSMYMYVDEIDTIHEDYIYQLASQYSNDFEKEKINLPPAVKNVNYLYGNVSFDYSHMGLSSDNASFLSKGINSVFFFSGKWKSGTIGIQESSNNSNIHHTSNDNIENVLIKYPELPNRVALVSDIVINLLQQNDFEETMMLSYENKSSYMFFVNKTYPTIFLCIVIVIALIIINIKKPKNPSISTKDTMQYEKLKEAVLNNTLEEYKQENHDKEYTPKLED